MTSRLISANASEVLKMDNQQLKQAIKASEGRTILSENVVVHEPAYDGVTNAEVARAMGADLILLNCFDVFHPGITALKADEPTYHDVQSDPETIQKLKQLIGAPVGVNLEPVNQAADMLETQLTLVPGRQATLESIQQAESLGFDFICLTGNPGTGVDNQAIIQALKIAKTHFSGLIIAGKMHGAGVDEPIIDDATLQAFIQAGADIILVPAVGTVPGFDVAQLRNVVKQAHQAKALVMTAIGTSQEGASQSVIEQMAIQNKICGVDIQHIGDAGYAGIAPVENIYALSKAIRGQRHTIARMARSINR